MATKVDIVKRDNQYDVYFYEGKDRVKYASGPWGYVQSAIYFYRAEGFEVKVYE